VLVVDLLPHQ